MWIKIGEELHCLNSKDIVFEVEHVKAHGTEKERKICRTLRNMLLMAIRKRTSQPNNARYGMKDFIAQARASTVQQESEEVYAALQFAASFHCLVDVWKDCEKNQAEAKRKVNFLGSEKRGGETSNGVVC